ncbi:2-oxoacid dehydrogenases acyltransferase-domain-containing protein [Gautieria morchelliformis]|nr:2-oxoacid dehydrogenases acyltransferase-domain-containing protein [Gautieria morchelliformis]
MILIRPLCFFSRRVSLSTSQFHTTSVLLVKRKVIHQFRLADIGEGITECEVIKWVVKPASLVQSFDPLCEVQSDKASVEITSPFDGIVKDLLVKEGDVARVGEGLCLIEVEEDAKGQAETATSEPISPEPEARAPPQPVDNNTESRSPSGRPHPLDPSHKLDASRDDVLATPSVRHFAKQKGVGLASIGTGTGKGGRIEKKDIEKFLSASSGSSQVTQLSEQPGEEIHVDLGRTRFAMWKAMTKSLEIPHFGYSTTLDLTRLSELLPVLNSYIPAAYAPQSPSSTPSLPPAISPDAIFPESRVPVESDPSTHFTRLTFLPLLLKALSRAMLEWPLFRASIAFSPDLSSKEKPKLSIRPHADIAIALSTPTGLYTPTLAAVETMTPFTIMGRLRRLQHLGRQIPCALGAAEMPRRGGTLTVSNVGAIGQGEFAAPVLVPGGGVAIVAIGRAKWVEVVPQDGVGPSRRRLLVGVSWSADHRVVEGAEMAAFTEAWRSWVEHPERMIADAV